jgi:hypothetical protein
MNTAMLYEYQHKNLLGELLLSLLNPYLQKFNSLLISIYLFRF